MTSSRMTIMGTRHVISAGHYLAAHAGFQVLEAGGNAIDAGVAAGLAIGVLQTDKVNLGGVAPQIIFTAKNSKVHCIDGLGVWPQAVTPDYFMKKHGGKIPPGIERCVVPAAPDAWITALSNFGTMNFGEVASAAIRFARDGFPMYPLMSQFIADNHAAYARWPSSRKVFLPRGKAPLPGEVFIQSDLGCTLQYMVDEEKRAARRKGRKAGLKAARDAFYKGDVAAQVTKFIMEEGGLMRYEDFAAFKVKFEPTVRTRFEGIDLHACGPWSQGPVLPMALNILKGYDLRQMGHNSAAYIHVVTEALKLAFADRHHHFGDPDFVKVPIAGLMSDKYAAYRRSQISIGKAYPEMPPAGDPKTLSMLQHRCVPVPQPDEAPGPGDTSYVCVIDRHGNAFSLHAERRFRQDADHPGCRHPVFGPRYAVVGRPGASVLGRARQASATDAQPGTGVQKRSGLHAVRNTGRRCATAGHVAGVPQHQCFRHGAAGCNRSTAFCDL